MAYTRGHHCQCVFQIAFNPLIKELRALQIGASIGNILVLYTAYADDLDIITLSLSAFQIMANLADRFGHKFQFEFNVPKCSVMEFSKPVTSIGVNLNGEPINRVDTVKK